ncbi:hypothetical protein [Bacillus swezeyi]|uniref:Uncharacterized protein n=1 Tax=Bacillus swezeyi TaxID=1925020 RepID=A0A5M8RZ64_9BACI|nr:hypothetical protein [Bacillus swezeyi]KAA6452778.1 hypothetical protein DX927_00745 [Bacillus swezeyi]KAA6476601.1 hypothetical protein DX928_11175 [Bacillus swezeyi]TYS38143.1 hypothetical protein FZC77_00680 [Bacillus swezeyi]
MIPDKGMIKAICLNLAKKRPFTREKTKANEISRSVVELIGGRFFNYKKIPREEWYIMHQKQ